MCGIAGVVGANFDPEEGRAAVQRMTDALSHRGPDGEGVYVAPGVALGHRRLAIIDPGPAGHQPMTRGALTLVYNGEVYNFRELRQELGGPFESDCDTEVVLQLYRRHGPACLDRLIGMFAFAIWDEEQRTLFAARDRLGIKPFHYRELPCGGFAFASELKALLELGVPEVDPTAVRDFLTYKYVPTPKTIYRGIRKLPPAHSLQATDGKPPRLAQYWKPESSESVTDFERAVSTFEPLWHEVVEGGLQAPDFGWPATSQNPRSGVLQQRAIVVPVGARPLDERLESSVIR